MKSWWLALPAVFLMTAFVSLARPSVASAGPNSQDLNYHYQPVDILHPTPTFTLWTQSFDPVLTPDMSVQSLKVDGVIFGNAPDCNLINGGAVRQCVFTGVVALQRIAATVGLSDGTLYAGETRVHCHNVATNGCDGVKTVGMR